MDSMEKVASNIGKNIRQLREARNLSQDQMSRLADIPRPTWSNLESGEANPTINVLLRVAVALQVSIEEIIGSPREACRFYKADTITSVKRGDTTIRKLLPEALPSTEFDRMALPPGSRMQGIPHRSGTREYLTCERGSIELAVAGEKYTLLPGDVVVFRGDQRHSYSNPSREKSIGFSVVVLAPMPI